MAEENREKIVERPQNKNLTPGGPGRPKGVRNFKTIQREALKKIAEARDSTPEEIEAMISEVGLLKAMKGDYNFYRDYMDRNYGKVPDKHLNITVNVEPTDRVKELAKKLNS